MVNVNVTLAGDTVVLTTDGDISEARMALIFAHSGAGRQVWIMREERSEVLRGYELTSSEYFSFVEDDPTEAEMEKVLQTDYVRYNGSVIPLNDFSSADSALACVPEPTWMRGWDACLPDTHFSGLVLRYNKDDESDNLPDYTGESGVTIATFIAG